MRACMSKIAVGHKRRKATEITELSGRTVVGEYDTIPLTPQKPW